MDFFSNYLRKDVFGDYQRMAELCGILCVAVSVVLQIVFRFFDRGVDDSNGKRDRSHSGTKGARESSTAAFAFLVLAWIAGYSDKYSTSSANILLVVSAVHVILFLFWITQDSGDGRYRSIRRFCLWYSLAGMTAAYFLH